MTQTVTPGLKYTFADHCAGALRFASGGTGSILDSDLPRGFEHKDFTSDPVRNQVDVYWSTFDQVYGVVVVSLPADFPLLPPTLARPAHDLLASPAPPAPFFLRDAATSIALANPPHVPELAEVAQRLRDLAGLPVGDVAAMVGLGRRQFYNLLDAGATSPETELRLRHLADLLEQLAGVVGEDPTTIRSALLTPVGSAAHSLFETALEGEETVLREIFDALLDRIEQRGLRQVRRAAPRRDLPDAGRQRADRAREVLDEMPTLDLDPEPDGEGG